MNTEPAVNYTLLKAPLPEIYQLSKWTWVRRCVESIGVVALCLAMTSCSSEAPGPEQLPVEGLLGAYELVSYEGRPLPTGNGRATYYGSNIVLEREQRYTQAVDAEICGPVGSCTRSTSSSGGTWLLLHDGTLYFDPYEGYGWPPPRIEAAGQEIRFYIPGTDTDTLSFTYRRR